LTKFSIGFIGRRLGVNFSLSILFGVKWSSNVLGGQH